MMKKSTCFVLMVLGLAISMSGCEHMKAGGGSGNGSSAVSTSGSSGEAMAPATGPNRMAHGAQGDSLEACLARIPDGATASQRMLAEHTCHRDAEHRKAIKAVPGQ